MPSKYPIVDVTEWEVIDSEVLGRNPKDWVREPEGGDDGQRDWLFKPVVVPSSTGHRQGEDWSEKIVSELGRALGVACAHVELARRRGQSGLISLNVVPVGWNRVLGSVMLGTVVEGYQGTVLDEHGRERKVPGRRGHSPEKIFEALRECEAPTGSAVGTAFEAFAGYLLLDAWVANQDRHDQNWAVLRRAAGPGALRLAPSYDHASSLGFNLTDDARRSQRGLDGMMRFAGKARAHRFEHDPRAPRSSVRTLVELAHHALGLAGGRAEREWLDRLGGVPSGHIESIVGRVPELSDAAATFVIELLDVNRRRLLRDS